MKYRWIHFASFVLVACLVLAGCASGGGATADGGKAAEEGSSAGESRTDDSSKAEESFERPEGFPEDLPVHTGKVSSYTSAKPNDIITMHMLEITTGDSYEDVLGWYRDELPEGWTLGELQEKQAGGAGKYAKFWLVGHGYAKSGSNALVTVFDEEPTRIQVNVSISSQ